MSKHTIIGVIVLMSISLLGVVGLQLYWINDAIKVKQEQFDRSVNTALTKVVEKLETHEAVSVVAHQMASLNKETPTPLPDTAHASALASAESHAHTPPKPAKKVAKPANQDPKPQPEKPKTTVLSVPSKKEAVTAHRVTYDDILQKSAPADFIIISPEGNIKFDNGRVTHPPGRKNLRDNKAAASAQAIAASPAFDSYLNLAEGLPDTIHFRNPVHGRAYSIDSEFQWEKVQEYRRLADSAASLFRSHHTAPLHISVDTLRFLAAEMGNLKHQKRIPITFEPAAISSINVRYDSIFIYHTDTARQAYFRRGTTTRSGNAARTTISREATQLKVATPLKGTAKLQETKVATPTRVTTKGQAAAVKPIRLPHARTDASSIEKIEIKKDKLNDVVQKMVVEYAVKDEPLQERLNLHGLHHLLKAELQQQGILLDFGFWVVAGQTDTVAAQNITAIRHQALPSYKATLFPNDIFDKPDYLGLYFPDSKAYALKSLWGMLSLSALFTLVIIATFGTTIHIIYKQKKLSEMKNDFINNMTHEFKTPIATISLATDSIANPKVYENPDKIQYYTRIIREENKRMNAQVENVLQIALLEKNEFKMNLQPIDVHALIHKAIEGIRLQVEQRLGQVNVQLNALQHELLSDEVHLYNVICNLLDNANKYSPATPDIQLVTKNVNGGILIAVEDKGIGMSKDTQQRVFEKFYRVPTGNLHNVKGFGLGLSYVKAIVQAHHGDISLKSELGKGSRFEIFLPIA
ncbi:sensor histidine kinase [Pontibacter diazotrophicus]|uniref:histidine kinase n=1 Tax=Pontibacter diazotrophicus TaxID=1400979 RepID=A0A3D8L9S1_9BACT|nr:HAMP domain-containing sensor histidine kinase [Pontibacter diazotrophicus]RDV13712.1 sensor histidine kinase [Pontibacter diazotrophicus]